MHVGTHMLNYDSMLTLTHFKGSYHGRLRRIQQELGHRLRRRPIGEGEIHTVPGSDNLWSIAEEELMERMTESTKATIDFFGDGIVYVNVMRNMSVSCDCEGTGAMPVVTPNAGILASTDICAIDSACVDLVYAMTEAGALRQPRPCRGIGNAPWPCVRSHICTSWGMGNWKYRLLDLDNGEAEIAQAEAVAHVKAPSRGNALQHNSSRTRVQETQAQYHQCGTKTQEGLASFAPAAPSGKSIRRSSD